MSKQKGFTLIELIVVIVILGILAATALPKFISVSADARAGVIKGVQGSMRAANTMLYGKAAAQNLISTADQTISTNGQTVTILNGYAKDATELAKVIDLNPLSDFTVASGSISHAKASDPTKCKVDYTAATATAAPVYTLKVDGDGGGDCS